jgi:hypothetical protein
LGSPQRGHGTKLGTLFFITCARRIAERDLDCLLFGTAMDRCLSFFYEFESFSLASAANGAVAAGCALHVQADRFRF